ncbi:MAG: LysR family transcriptional regulator, partial [Pseudomonadota bacterium]
MSNIERLSVNGDGLLLFVTIAECQNLTAAAERLNKTQSALSVQLGKLESALNTRLFTRSQQGMALTPDGEKLLPSAHRAVAQLREIQGFFAEQLRGVIRLGLPDDCAERVLEQALRQFRAAHPEVEVVVVAGCTSTFEKQIAKGELDIAVCSGPAALSEHLHSTEPTVWAASSHAAFQLCETLPLAQLDRRCWWREMTEAALTNAKIPFRNVFLSNDYTSLKAAIRSGLAVGVLPRSGLDPALRSLSAADGLPSLPP